MRSSTASVLEVKTCFGRDVPARFEPHGRLSKGFADTRFDRKLGEWIGGKVILVALKILSTGERGWTAQWPFKQHSTTLGAGAHAVTPWRHTTVYGSRGWRSSVSHPYEVAEQLLPFKSVEPYHRSLARSISASPPASLDRRVHSPFVVGSDTWPSSKNPCTIPFFFVHSFLFKFRYFFGPLLVDTCNKLGLLHSWCISSWRNENDLLPHSSDCGVWINRTRRHFSHATASYGEVQYVFHKGEGIVKRNRLYFS